MTGQETRSEYAERMARFWAREASRLAARAGWSVFGTHVDQVTTSHGLEFDGSDECGMPLWERPAHPPRTDAADDTALVEKTEPPASPPSISDRR